MTKAFRPRSCIERPGIREWCFHRSVCAFRTTPEESHVWWKRARMTRMLSPTKR